MGDTDTLDLTVNAAKTSIAYLDTKIDEVRTTSMSSVILPLRLIDI